MSTYSEIPPLNEETPEINPYMVLEPNFNPYEYTTEAIDFILFKNILKMAQITSPTPFAIVMHKMDYPSTLHQHDFIELTYVPQGQALLVINRKPYLLDNNSICLTPANTPHFIAPFSDDKDCTTIINLLLTPKLLSEIQLPYFDTSLLSEVIKNTNPLYVGKQQFYHCSQSLHKLLKQYSQENYQFSYGLLGRLIIFLNDLSEIQHSQNKVFDELSNDVLALIKENLQEVSITFLAEKLNYSVGHLSRHVKNHTGHTIAQLIAKEKLYQAELALSKTTMSISEIAESVGYQSESHFYKVFKEEYHVTPKQYKQLLEESQKLISS